MPWEKLFQLSMIQFLLIPKTGNLYLPSLYLKQWKNLADMQENQWSGRSCSETHRSPKQKQQEPGKEGEASVCFQNGTVFPDSHSTNEPRLKVWTRPKLEWFYAMVPPLDHSISLCICEYTCAFCVHWMPVCALHVCCVCVLHFVQCVVQVSMHVCVHTCRDQRMTSDTFPQVPPTLIV